MRTRVRRKSLTAKPSPRLPKAKANSSASLAVAVNTILSVLAPYVAGRLYDLGYGYQGSFLTFSIWCLIGAVVLFMVRPPSRRAPELVAVTS